MGIDKILTAIFQETNWESVGIIDIIAILLNVIKLLLILGNTVAVIFLVWNAYGYINNYGNEEAVKKAKNGITAVITGVVIITISFFIVSFVYYQFVDTKKNPYPTEIQKAIPADTSTKTNPVSSPTKSSTTNKSTSSNPTKSSPTKQSTSSGKIKTSPEVSPGTEYNATRQN